MWTRLAACMAVSVIAVAACATGAEGDGGEDNDSDGGSVGAGGMGGAKADTTSSSTSGGMGAEGGMGGFGGMGPECDPPGHMCGGICVGNTPATGCYQSASCSSCPNVVNGTATCSADGLCEAQCNAPYVPNGAVCNCPMQCCSNADCGGSDTCENGSCVSPQTCDQAACIIICAITNQLGVCVGPNCNCI